MRVRTTAAATVALVAAFAAGAAVLVYLVHRSAYDSVRSGARDELRSILLIEASTGARSLPAGHQTALAQIVDRSGRVVASSRSGDHQPMAHLRVRPGRISQAVRQHLPADPDPGPFLVVADAAAAPVPRGDVGYVAASLQTVNDAAAEAARAAWLVGTVFVGLTAGLMWFLIGRALRPVEAIRAEVADISDGQLERRVPVPASDDEIGRLALTMNAMLSRLDDAARRQRQFVADAAHELRSPLATMLSQLDVASRYPGMAPVEELAASLRCEALRLAAVLSDLSVLARGDEGRVGERFQLLDLDDIVLEEASRVSQRGRIAVDVGAVSAAQVRGNPAQLSRIVRNLLDNAERYAARRVVVSLRESAQQVVLQVADDGPGIPPADRERIFQRFVRLDSARERSSGGSGLGLAIVRQLVGGHGGTVAVEDNGGSGSRLVVRLPSAAGP